MLLCPRVKARTSEAKARASEAKAKDLTFEAKAKDLTFEAKAEDLTSEAKDKLTWPRGASGPRPWPRGLHLWYDPYMTCYMTHS